MGYTPPAAYPTPYINVSSPPTPNFGLLIQSVKFIFTGTTEGLQDELNALTYVLIHAESHMRKTIAENMQVNARDLPHNTARLQVKHYIYS